MMETIVVHTCAFGHADEDVADIPMKVSQATARANALGRSRATRFNAYTTDRDASTLAARDDDDDDDVDDEFVRSSSTLAVE